ncbi:MAG TPA: hypothetical protein VGR06_00630 [Actinophytocola sp.]|jgi:hypothetical protein|uniref:hypothetical protein n=1 Tax=Actinophytocola sp. TaxID=1872138 RepID=UPI002E060A63|nr:hypothetical protein [Actinophytocola sp.]
MSGTAIAAGVLASSLAITVVLGKAKVFGALAVAGFVLGSLATAALFFLLS